MPAAQCSVRRLFGGGVGLACPWNEWTSVVEPIAQRMRAQAGVAMPRVHQVQYTVHGSCVACMRALCPSCARRPTRSLTHSPAALLRSGRAIEEGGWTKQYLLWPAACHATLPASRTAPFPSRRCQAMAACIWGVAGSKPKPSVHL
jgi:hypothetical protein